MATLSSADMNCPEYVDVNNWYGTDTYGDAFCVEQDGTEITVHRADSISSWGVNLRFNCCDDYGVHDKVCFES